MNAVRIVCCAAALVFLFGCTASDSRSDREIISSIAKDLDVGVVTGDMMKIDKHLSREARQDGFEANKFMMECSYSDSLTPGLTAWSIKVMGDSAQLDFVLMPDGMQFSDSLPKSQIRLLKSDTWKVVSFQIARNEPAAPPATATPAAE
jgi:hypothetical protein